MREVIKLFSIFCAVFIGFAVYVLGMFWLLSKLIAYNQWLMIPMLIVAFAFYGTALTYPFYKS